MPVLSSHSAPFLVLLFQLIRLSAFGQTCTGRIYDSESRDAIPFVNIGILGKSAGTVSNAEGEYTLTLTSDLDNDSIRIFMVGYAPKTFFVSDFKKGCLVKNQDLHLDRLGISLDEIVILSKKTKTKIAGHTFNNKSFILGLATTKAGCEIGALIHIKKQATFVKQININIAQNPFDSLLFRINLYDAKDGRPGKNILKTPIYVSPKIKTGLVSVDVSKDYIVVEDDFFVAVQWIGSSGKEVLSFCAGIGGKAFLRTSSEDTWISNAPFGLGINCKIAYQVQ